MLDDSARLPSIPTATWLDEVLLAARSANRIVGVRFGRSADPLCLRADDALREAVDAIDMDGLLSVYTVDIDEVPEFTYMYELYDPFTFMLFHRSKPLLFDAGYGPTRKLTELSSHSQPLPKLLAKVARQALELGTLQDELLDVAASAAAVTGVIDVPVGDERSDDAATFAEEATRLARGVSGWLGTKFAPAVERSCIVMRLEEAAWLGLLT